MNKNPELRKIAYQQFNSALSAGLIQRKPCEICGKNQTDGHHDRYSRPLAVRWLCRQHHQKVHGKNIHPVRKQINFIAVFDSRNRRIRGLWVRDGLYYVQLRLPGKSSPTRVRLYNGDKSDPQTAAQAVAAMQAILVDKRAGRAPVLKSSVQTVGDICQRYLDEGCPCRSASDKRAGKEPEREAFRVEMLLKSPLAKIHAALLTAKDWEKYRSWRITQLKSTNGGTPRGRGGDSVVDHERITLSNVYRQAVWHSDETKIEINRVTALKFKRYRDPAKVVHCRSHKPRSGDELHAIARHAFQSGPRSEVLGWFILFCARIGHRAAAMLTLRADAKLSANAEWPEPGYVANGNIYLYRSSTSKGTVGHLEIDPDFQSLIDAHRAWLARRHPTSPWYFPSPYYHDQTIRNESLTHWLALVCPKLGLGHRTTHGLRSFRTTCLRSQGKSAAECAELLGQKSAGRLVMEVYGERLDYVVDWMPKDRVPAWTAFDGTAPSVPIQAA